MKEKSEEEINKEKNYIKVLNKEKVLEFKLNSSGFDESEIIFQNISQEDIISKIYINNYHNFKVIPNIIITKKNLTSKIKVIMDNKDYIISNSDVFLIISHHIDNSNFIDKKNLNEYFTNNRLKEKGEKVFLVGYKKSEVKKDKNRKDDELIKRIKELEKEVFDDDGKDVNKIHEIKEEIKEEKKGYSFITYLILFSLLAFTIRLVGSKFFKK